MARARRSKPVCPLGREGRVGELFHSLARAAAFGAAPYRQLGRQGSSLSIRRQRGELIRQSAARAADGRPRSMPDRRACRPIAFMLTGGQMADCTAGAQLLERLPPCRILHGDKGYDTDAIRRQIEATGAMPNIPPKANRRWKNASRLPLPRCNAIERMFCRLKDFRASPLATTAWRRTFSRVVCGTLSRLERHGEGEARLFFGRRDVHRPAMPLCDLVDDEEPEAEALLAAANGAPEEGLE